MKIGVTERGDAGIDFSWADKLKTVDGAILITKNANEKFCDLVIKNKEKIIIHATCTGYGGTELEPNVPTFNKQIENIKDIVLSGFPIEKIVLRVDPIIPTESGLYVAEVVIRNAKKEIPELKRVRFSLIDMYPHVRNRFKENRIELPYGDGFSPTKEDLKRVNEWIKKIESQYDVHLEACAENTIAESVGCVSKKDLNLLGLTYEESGAGYQRKECKCLGCKTELLTEKKQCPHKCLYCYWKG